MPSPFTLAQVPAPTPKPDFWDKALDQVPGLAVVCVLMMFVVWRFLNHLTTADERREKSETARDARQAAAMKAVGDSCHEFQSHMAEMASGVHARAIAALDRNTETLGRADGMADVLAGEIRELRRENEEGHMLTRHALNNLANAAAWEKELQKVEHRIKGGPLGTSVTLATPGPAEARPAEESDGA